MTLMTNHLCKILHFLHSLHKYLSRDDLKIRCHIFSLQEKSLFAKVNLAKFSRFFHSRKFISQNFLDFFNFSSFLARETFFREIFFIKVWTETKHDIKLIPVKSHEKGLVFLVAKTLKDIANHSLEIAKVFLHFPIPFKVNASRYSGGIKKSCKKFGSYKPTDCQIYHLLELQGIHQICCTFQCLMYANSISTINIKFNSLFNNFLVSKSVQGNCIMFLRECFEIPAFCKYQIRSI